MNKNEFKIGDKVKYAPEVDENGEPYYHEDEYIIEIDYGNDVYFIGNENSWCDCVPGAWMIHIQ